MPTLPISISLASLLQSAKTRTYELMRLRPGARVLDVGCGPGTDTIPLAQLVGENGQVIGVDHDAKMIAEANAWADKAGVIGWVEHRIADSSMLPFDDNYFDACRAERLFQHLRDPQPTLDEMERVTKPGGWVVVLDTDYASESTNSDEFELERKYARFLADHSVNNGLAARQLPGWLRRHGLVDIAIELFPIYYDNYALGRTAGNMDRIDQLALQLGAFTTDELTRWYASLERADAAGAYLTSANMVLAAGRKPA